jgi:hypothetical protein
MNYKRVILFTDQNHVEQAKYKRSEMLRDGQVCKLINVQTGTEYEETLAQQPLGSQVLICTQEKKAQNIYQAALRAGFVQKDILVISKNEPSIQVFCSQCHDIQQVDWKKTFTCRNCWQKIEPSDHYSDYHLAYLAYPSFD